MSISLEKGQRISLEKPGGGALSKVTMGLGWDAVKKRGLFGMREQEIDLDASAVLFDANGNAVDAVWFRQLKSKCGSLVHTGDNRTGAGDGDDEQIICDLQRVPAKTSLKSRMRFVASLITTRAPKPRSTTCRARAITTPK